jgi:hypothetical protein
VKKTSVLLVCLLLSACYSQPARTVDNICSLMSEKVSWYQAVKLSEEKYNVPKYIQLAIIHQESHFASDAFAEKSSLFKVISWRKPGSAYGFAQAKDDTWSWYQLKTGNKTAVRDNFKDAVDFVAWYVNQSSKRLGIAKSDVYQQYLAYHEGHGGFENRTFLKKPWLIKVAKKVKNNAKKYQQQLKVCSKDLDNNYVWSFF